MCANVGVGMTPGPHHSLSLFPSRSSTLPSRPPSRALFLSLCPIAASLFASSNDLSIEAINAAGFDYPHCSSRQRLHMVVQIKQFIYTHAIKLDTHRTHPPCLVETVKCIKRNYLYTSARNTVYTLR